MTWEGEGNRRVERKKRGKGKERGEREFLVGAESHWASEGPRGRGGGSGEGGALLNGGSAEPDAQRGRGERRQRTDTLGERG